MTKELEGAPETIWVHHYSKDRPEYPFEGWWHMDKGASGEGIGAYTRKDISDKRIAELTDKIDELESELAETYRPRGNQAMAHKVAAVRNKAFSEVLNIIRENTPYTPPDGPETAEHLVAIESMQSIHYLVEALKTESTT